MTILSQTGRKKRRGSLLFLYLGLGLFLIGCTRSPSENLISSEPKRLSNKEPSIISGEEIVSGEESPEETTTEAPIETSDPEDVTKISRSFLSPKTTGSSTRTPQPITQSKNPDVTLTPSVAAPVPAETPQSPEPWILQRLSYVSETLYGEINTGRQGASLEPLAWDSELEVDSINTIESVYSSLAYDALETIHNNDGYLIYFSSEIQLGETEMANRFNELLDSNNSLRAGLFDDRFTRVGIASGISIRPETHPPYVYLCHINPAGEPLTTVTPSEPEEELPETSQPETSLPSEPGTSPVDEVIPETTETP